MRRGLSSALLGGLLVLLVANATVAAGSPSGHHPFAAAAIVGHAMPAAAQPPGSPPYETSARVKIAPDANKEGRLDSRLAAVQRAADTSGDAAALGFAERTGLRVHGKRVAVVIDTTDVPGAGALVAGIDGAVERIHGRLVQAAVPPGRLHALAAGSHVAYVRPPFQAVAEGVAGEGVGATNASAWQQLGRTGSGAKVAVIDLGFAGYAYAQANGDLPAVTTVNFCEAGFPGTEPHGTGVAEIVHEMAPDAALTLICIDSDVGLAQAEEYVKAQGISIVNHSVGWYGTSRGDGSGGSGTPDAIVADARAHGILWVNAAGNDAQRHWSGVFSDTNADGWHDFTASDMGNSFYVPAGGHVCVFLKWDAWPTTSQDFDLYVARSSDGALVGSSTTLQNGTQTPREGTCFENTSGYDDWFFAAIYKFAATAKPRLDMVVMGDAYYYTGNIQYQTAAGSLAEPASSPNVLAVGAICWQSSAREPYSSEGPTIDNRVKPDIAGPDSVSGFTYGGFLTCGSSGFPGTSASAPHVAGAAALVKGMHPLWTPAQVQADLIARAQDLGSAGKDNLYGAGKLRLTIAAPAVSGFTPAVGPVGTTVTITGSNLMGTSAVRFNGVEAAPTAVAATSVKAPIPVGASTGPIQVATPDGTATSLTAFKVSPRITGFSPVSAIRGAVIEIDGNNFTGASKVLFGAVAATPTVDSDTVLHVTVPATALTGKLTVTTAAGSGISATSFVVILPPTISSFAPTSGPIHSDVTINGTQLDSVTAATVNGTPVVVLTHINATSLRISIPSGATSGKLTVTNAAGTFTSASMFMVTPKIFAFSPGSGPAGSTVHIIGINFTGATTVKVGAVPATFTVDSDTVISAKVPSTATTGKLTVTTPSGSGTSATNFVVILRPTVTAFTPASGPAGSVVTVTGTNLDSVTAATLGGTNVGTITPVSPTQIRFTIPNPVASGPITVTNAAGSATSATSFTVTLSVGSFSPTWGPPGTRVAISGIFTTISGVKIGDLDAEIVSATTSEVDIVVPNGARTGPITVGSGSGAVTTSMNFTVTLPVVVDLGTLSSFTCWQADLATAISDDGVVVGGSCRTVQAAGGYYTHPHAFRWANRALSDLFDGVVGPSMANAINSSGTIVGMTGGQAEGSAGGDAFMAIGNTVTSLHSVLGDSSAAWGINDSGEIVGNRGGFSSYSAYLYDTHAGIVTTLPGIGTTFRVSARAINTNGNVAGWQSATGVANHALLWLAGTPHDLGTLGGSDSAAYAINDADDLVGYAALTGDTASHAFLYHSGTMHDLGTLSGNYSTAYAINDSGDVVGSSAGRAFLYHNGTMIDLNTWLPPGSGWTLSDARGINSLGQIVGTGTHNGNGRPFLLNPPSLTQP